MGYVIVDQFCFKLLVQKGLALEPGRLTLKGHILKSASAITLITLISRICGYLRDQRIALLLGTSPAADAFILAFRIPSLVRRLAGEGAFGGSFIPIFSSYLREKPRDEAFGLARTVFWDVAAILTVLAVLGVVFSRQVIYIFTMFSASEVHWDLAVSLNRVMFPCVIFIGLSAVAAAILNCFQVFALPAATPVVFNVTMVIFSLGAVYKPLMARLHIGLSAPAVALAIAVLIGSALQIVLLIPALLRHGVRLEPAVEFRDPGVQRIGKLMGPGVFAACAYQINLLLGTFFATSPRMPSGSVSSLYVAERLMQLVLGTYAIAISTALLPTLSHQAAAGKYDEMKRTFGFSLRIVSFITIPAAVGLILLREPIIQVLFQHGQFAARSTALTANALFYYALGLPAYGAIWLITPMFYSTQDTRTPARISVYMLVANLVLNAIFLVAFYRTLSNGSPALASSICAYLNFGTLFFIFHQRHGNLGTRGILRSLAKTATCAFAMAAVALGSRIFWHHRADALHVAEKAGLLCLIILAAVAAYLGLARLLRCEELDEFLLLLQRAEPSTVPGAEYSA
ncbi:MAG TPA: murein biosynthesis integral membrane protein MurJ [Candidatus Acidoferrum sp.]|nr:murein biosynthesis integral membrane protein MurJ [Candidatus Acidoferrum sp.]